MPETATSFAARSPRQCCSTCPARTSPVNRPPSPSLRAPGPSRVISSAVGARCTRSSPRRGPRCGRHTWRGWYPRPVAPAAIRVRISEGRAAVGPPDGRPPPRGTLIVPPAGIADRLVGVTVDVDEPRCDDHARRRAARAAAVHQRTGRADLRDPAAADADFRRAQTAHSIDQARW